MVWYYAEGDRQKGPISDEEFQELVQKGRIHKETLIWKDGLDNWQPLETAREAGLVNISPLSTPAHGMPATAIPASHSPGSTVASPVEPPATESSSACAQCGRSPLGAHDSVQLGNLLLCRNCDADLARHYSQAAPLQPEYDLDGHPGTTRQPSEGVFPGSVTMPFASILSRAAAKLIDNLLETVVLMIIIALTTDLAAIGDALRSVSDSPEQLIIALRPFLLTSLVFKVLYDAILVGKFGATLGKMALGIKVVASNGSHAGYNHAIIRAVAPAIIQLPGIMMPSSIIANVAQFLFLFAYLIAVFDIQKRTLFDHMANTRVVRQ